MLCSLSYFSALLCPVQGNGLCCVFPTNPVLCLLQLHYPSGPNRKILFVCRTFGKTNWMGQGASLTSFLKRSVHKNKIFF
uniref:Putative secreted protein n=1 Tax=Rhipicephalus microplus TaxID=6941 RepID=A0A6M2DAW4_RHIMP